jgi:hypothetical protein
MIKRLFALAVLLLAAAPRAHALPPCAGTAFNNGGMAMFGGTSCEHSPTLDHPVASSLQVPPLANAAFLTMDSTGKMAAGTIVPYASLPIGNYLAGQITGYVAAADDGRFAQLVDVTSYGAVANANATNPLGIRFGSPSQQQICPEATSVNDEQAWCGFQGAFDKAAAIAGTNLDSQYLSMSGVRLHIPGNANPYLFNRAWVLNDASVRVEGDCEMCTRLQWYGVTDGIVYGKNPVQVRSGSLELAYLSVARTGFGGIGLRPYFNNTHPTLNIHNVTIGLGYVPSQSTPLANVNAWATGAMITNGNDVKIRDMTVRMWPGSGAGHLIALSATSNSITFSGPLTNYTFGLPMGDLTNPGITFTASASGTVLNVTSPGQWPITFNNVVTAGGSTALAAGTRILAQVDGTPGGVGHYTLNIAQTVASENMSIAQGIPDSCASASVVGNTIFTDCQITVQPGDDIEITSQNLVFYAPNQTLIGGQLTNELGHFDYTIEDSFFAGGASGCLGFHANSGVGLQGVKINNNGCGNTNEFVRFGNGLGTNMPWLHMSGNQAQIDGDFCHCENISEIKGDHNNYYVGLGAKNATQPLPKPLLAIMWDIYGGGQNNEFDHNLMGTYPGGPPLTVCMRARDNHDISTSNVCGYGKISPLTANYQLQESAANFTMTSDVLYNSQAGTATATQVAGDHTVTVSIARLSGWALIPGMVASDTDNPASLSNCPVQSSVTNSDGTLTVTLVSTCSVTGPVAIGDGFGFTSAPIDEQANWLTAFQATALGGNVIYVEAYSMPAGLTANMPVSDLLFGTVPAGCLTTFIDYIGGRIGLGCNTTAQILPGYVFNLQAPYTNITAVNRNMPVDSIYDQSAVLKLNDSCNDLLITFNGASTHDIYEDDMPCNGQIITIKDAVGIGGQYPATWHSTSMVDGSMPTIKVGQNGLLQLVRIGQRWNLLNYISHATGGWTPTLTDANGTDVMTLSSVTAAGTFKADATADGKCSVFVYGFITATPHIVNGVGLLQFNGLPRPHESGTVDDLAVTNYSAFTWPGGATSIEWESVGTSTYLVLRGLKSGASSSANTLPFSGLTSDAPITLGVTGRYWASGC